MDLSNVTSVVMAVGNVNDINSKFKGFNLHKYSFKNIQNA